VLLGFLCFGTSSLSTAISTALIFLASGGVNLSSVTEIKQSEVKEVQLRKEIRAEVKKNKLKAN
jgi:hypothetical protein